MDPPCKKRVRREHDCNDGGNKDTASRDYPLPMTSGEDNVKLLSRQTYHTNTDCEQFNATPKSTGSIQDLNHDILSIIYSFIYEPRLDRKCSRSLVEGDFHIGHLFLNIAPVCKDLRQSCIHHAQTVPLILRFDDEFDDRFIPPQKDRNNTFFSAILRWALIVCPKISKIILELHDFSNAKICMNIIQNCNLACLIGFTIYSPWTPDNNESQPDWVHIQNMFVHILRSYTTSPPIQKLKLKCDCGAIDENLLDTVARTVTHLFLKFRKGRNTDFNAISQAIERLGHLTYLRIYGNSSEAISVTSQSLKKLNIYGSSSLIGGIRIGALSCPVLKVLTCSGIHTISPSYILGYAESLETLKLYYLDWSEESEHIELERINEMSEAIQRLPKLRSICIFNFSVVSSQQLLYDSLKFLEYHGCKITILRTRYIDRG
jgi:hypothetical protein